MRLKLLPVLFLLWPPLLLAQFTQVSGTVTDPTGLPYSNGTITPTLVCSSSPRFASSGFGYSPPTQPVALDAKGSFVMQLGDVNQLLPPGCTWSFQTCSAAGTVQPGSPITSGPVCFTITGIVVTGPAMNISSQLDAAAPKLTNISGGTGGSGTVSPGTVGQYAIYNGTTSVTSTPNLGESTGSIRAGIPVIINSNSSPDLTIIDNAAGPAFQITDGVSNTVSFDLTSGSTLVIGANINTGNLQANAVNFVGQTTLTPTAGVNSLAANSSGALLYSQNGGPYTPIGSGGGATTRTWSFAFQGVCQGNVASAPISIPLTNGPTYVSCDATHITAEWQIPASSTTANFFVKLRVPPGVTGAYTLTTTFRSAATSGSLTLQPAVACVAPGAVPDNPTFSTAGISPITLTPSATTLANVTTTGMFTPTCAAGSDLYVQYTFPANTITSPVNFSYVNLSVQGSL